MTSIRVGRYCLTMLADPSDRLLESDEADGGRSRLVRIRHRTVTDLGRCG